MAYDPIYFFAYINRRMKEVKEEQTASIKEQKGMYTKESKGGKGDGVR